MGILNMLNFWQDVCDPARPVGQIFTNFTSIFLVRAYELLNHRDSGIDKQ